jgi:hypothetical protein
MSGEIGPLFSPHLIEEAVLSQLMRRLPLYSKVALEQWGVKLPEVVSWGLKDEEDTKFPEQGFPALVVIADETRSIEEHTGGWYRATWPFQVAIWIQHAEIIEARKLAQIYGAVIQAALLQRRSLGLEGTGGLTWEGQKLPFEPERERTTAISLNSFSIVIDEVVNWRNGPKNDLELPEEPPGPDPEITEVDVNVVAAEVAE